MNFTLLNLFIQDDNVDEEGETNYKKGQQFAQHMKEATQASSNFAMTKSLAQQRQYLPVFAVRQEVSTRKGQYPSVCTKFPESLFHGFVDPSLFYLYLIFITVAELDTRK